jgi:hypothetical protein
MLPPFIIEQIRKREKEERANREQPQLDIPLQMPLPCVPEGSNDDIERGVVILEV